MDDFTVDLKCLFCSDALIGSENQEYNENDLIACQSCGEKNHYESLIEVATSEAIHQVKSELESKLSKIFKS